MQGEGFFGEGILYILYQKNGLETEEHEIWEGNIFSAPEAPCIMEKNRAGLIQSSKGGSF